MVGVQLETSCVIVKISAYEAFTHIEVFSWFVVVTICNSSFTNRRWRHESSLLEVCKNKAAPVTMGIQLMELARLTFGSRRWCWLQQIGFWIGGTCVGNDRRSGAMRNTEITVVVGQQKEVWRDTFDWRWYSKILGDLEGFHLTVRDIHNMNLKRIQQINKTNKWKLIRNIYEICGFIQPNATQNNDFEINSRKEYYCESEHHYISANSQKFSS